MSDQAQALAAHNQARQLVNSQHGGNRPDLVWDDNLAAAAQQWANYMAQQGQLLESTQTPAGANDNVAWYQGTFATASLMGGVTQWLNEVSLYNGEAIGQTGPGGGWEQWGHYTQAIWPTTTNVGVAVAAAPNNNFYVCGYYSPGGNVQGQSAWGSNPTVPPAPSATDCVYLVNSNKGEQWTSGLAWYPSQGPNDGTQPGQYVDLDTKSAVTWEGNSFAGTLPNGNSVTVAVNADGHSQPVGAAVGTAQESQPGPRALTVYRDAWRVLYEIDGWKVFVVYRCA